MKDDLFTDKQLADALTSVQDRHMEVLLQSAEPHEFSDDFKDKMNALFRTEKRYATMQKIFNIAVAALVSIVIGLALFFTISTQARATALAWIKREFGHYSVIDFLLEADDVLPECELSWIPNNLECVVDETVLGRTLVYIDPEMPERGFTLMYMRIGEESNLVITELDKFELIELSINGNYAELYISKEPNMSHMLTWLDEEKGIAFGITAALEVDEMLRIADNIKIK